MKFITLFFLLVSTPSYSWVHISQLKPRLPAESSSDTIYFYWDGVAPEITGKSDVFEGQFSFSSDSDLMYEILNQAVERWNEVETSYLTMQVEINTNLTVDANDNTNAIVTSNLESQSIAAYALPQYLAEDNNALINDCDITISNDSVSANDLYYTLIHELGHCIGLGHPHSNYGALMGYSRLSRLPTLGADDIAGISFIYPITDLNVENYKLFCSTMAGSSNVAFVFLILPLFVLLARRRE